MAHMQGHPSWPLANLVQDYFWVHLVQDLGTINILETYHNIINLTGLEKWSCQSYIFHPPMV